MHSDHCPLLLLLHNNENTKVEKLFKFETMWMSHPDLIDIVSNVWSDKTDLNVAILYFTEKVKDWNKDNFGNIFHKKNK